MARTKVTAEAVEKKSKKATPVLEDAGTKIVNHGYELVDPSTLKQHPKNARRGNVGVIDDSVEANGFYGALIVQKSTRTILKGNHTHRVAMKRKMASVPVIWVDVDEPTSLRILAVDNRANDLGGYDEKLLRDLLGEMKNAGNLIGTGYDDEALAKILAADVPPSDFKEFDENTKTEHVCPKCGYEWNAGQSVTTKSGATKSGEKTAASKKP